MQIYQILVKTPNLSRFSNYTQPVYIYKLLRSKKMKCMPVLRSTAKSITGVAAMLSKLP